ncbi:MAG: hypothetical protein H5U28_00850 [Burkholderiaceae bacterium]|nr:hypothetical protein [Burkholderiaceae bacterium]
MAVYEESGLRLDLPDGGHFRLAATAGYRPLSGQYLKEMDFSWVHEDKLVLLEVKDFTQTTAMLAAADFVPVKNQPNPWRFDELVGKITDTILMMLASWSGTAWGKSLAAELPAAVRKPIKLVLAVALDLPANLKVYLGALKTALNDRLKGRLKVAGVEAVALMDYDTLISRPTFSPYVSRLLPA